MVNSSSDAIASAVRAWIDAAPEGAQLPSTRALVAEHHASPVTVQRALRTLIAQGRIESRPGVGTFVRHLRPARQRDYGWQTAALGSPVSQHSAVSPSMRTPPNDVIALHSGYPDRELLPEKLVRSALTRAARSDSTVNRPPVSGLPELQGWFCSELANAPAPGVGAPVPADVIVLPGSQSGLSSLFRALVGAGGPLVIESPTYWGAILAARQVGVRLIPVPSGPNGPEPEALDRAFRHSGARAFYAQPNYANPTGVQWSAELSDEVLDVVRRHEAFVIEDDWAHDFGISTESAPLAARDGSGHVVYLRSLTKSVSPAIRVAGVIARGPVRQRILSDTQAQAMYVSGVLQQAALDVVTQPAWRTHLRRLRTQLESRRDLLVEALREHAPAAQVEAVPPGGLNLWLRLPDTTDLTRFGRDCESHGLIVGAGDEWFPAEPAGRFLRLNYAGPNPGAFTEAARIIGKSLE